MRFKINDTWYTHKNFNSMMVELTPDERNALLQTTPTQDEDKNVVVRFASFVNDAAHWREENQQAWINDKPIPQPDVKIVPMGADERTKWERERLAQGLPIT